MIDLSRVPIVVFRDKDAHSGNAFRAQTLIPIPRQHYHGKGGGWGDYSISNDPAVGYGSTRKKAVENLRKDVFESLSTLLDFELSELDASGYQAHIVHSE